MTRIPTYMTYVNQMNSTLRNKATFELYNFQSLTGLKSPTYAGYGNKAYNIVSLEASLTVTNNFMDNNKLLQIETKMMNTALDSVYDTVTKFKSMLGEFAKVDFKNATPDYTGGKLFFNSDVMADYMGKTITVEGTQYTFANNGTGNNIDISAATDGIGVMAALQAKLPANVDYTFNQREWDFPPYTINGTSSILNVSGVATGEPKTMDEDLYLSMQQVQGYAFSAMKILADNLNTNVAGKYVFGGGNSNKAPINFPFGNLEEFQKYYDGIDVTYPTNAAADLSNREVTADDTGALTIVSTGSNTGSITSANAGGFLKEAISANPNTTGDLIFNADKDTINATQYGAFNTLKAGDTLVINGTGGNDKTYIIKSVSADGKTVTVDDSTPIVADQNVVGGTGVTFSTSFPIGSVITMDGFGSNISPEVQVTGVSPDGKTLYITGDPSRLPSTPTVIAASSDWGMHCDSYYQGGDLTYEKRISDNQTIVFDVNANDPVFEKIFRALGEIAQGNLIDTRNPKDSLDTLIDPSVTYKRTSDAMDLIYEALYNPGSNSNVKNMDLYTVLAKVSSNSLVLEETMDNQVLMVNNLKNDIYLLKNVDQTDAAAKSLTAKTNLEASYAVLQQAMSLSLLNYMK